MSYIRGIISLQYRMLVMHVTPEIMKMSFCRVKKHGTPSKKLEQTNVGTTI